MRNVHFDDIHVAPVALDAHAQIGEGPVAKRRLVLRAKAEPINSELHVIDILAE